MNRNTNSRFSIAPQANIERSKFNRDSTVKTSFNVGECIPFYLEEVLPGDTFQVKTSKIARMQTLKTPMMDDVFMDTYYFFVPNRLIWSHWKEFMGENTASEWIPQNTYTIPKISAPSGGWSVGSIADYLGIPPSVSNLQVNALPFRAYALICNEWFRDENLQDPLVIETGDSTVTGSNGDTYVTDVAKGGAPYLACKTHDYFTSALPAPQKGPDVQVSMISPNQIPVFTMDRPNEHFYNGKAFTNSDADILRWADYKGKVNGSYPIMYGWKFNNSYPYQVTDANNQPWTMINWIDDEQNSSGGIGSSNLRSDTGGALMASVFSGSTSTGVGYTGKNMGALNEAATNYSTIVPLNLVADATGGYVYTTINELRQAFQIQRYYEKLARGGSRYIEIIKSMFGVTSPDARMMRPEYLGGNRLPLNVRQITQTSSTTENQPLGDVAGMSVTTDNHFDFEKSFTEHGYIIGICVARYHHTYQQGVERLFNRSTRFDFYWPVFAHLGEQPIYNKEIYAQGSSADTKVFGYQEAWAEYRYKPNRVSGMMRSVANTGLDTWHMADDYDSLPYLSDSWIVEDKANLDRVLSVTSSTANQIFADIYVQNKTTRAMPMYSIPGLIDHF